MTTNAVRASAFDWTEFTPKLITVLREGYAAKDLRADAIAGLTVAIVALPLSMAIAIASGVSPDRGLTTAIVGGFVVSLLGGSRYQIAGPAGAFIVLVAGTVARHGVDGLILATMLAGCMLMAAGFLRLGAFVRYIPYPVTVGFTAAIAVVIAVSQLRDFLGVRLAGHEPAEVFPKLIAILRHVGAFNPQALAIGVGALVIISLLRKYRPTWPAYLIAVAGASAAAALWGADIATIGSTFGAMPHGLPAPRLPDMSLPRIAALLPDAASFALLGGIESLLSAVVADTMSGARHRSNTELVAQGAANIASALFGGICVTGTIARTATNVRAHARGPVSGMLHSLILLAFLAVAAPALAYIPLAALAAVLLMVAWHMAEKEAFATLLRASRGDAAVLLATFLLTLFYDLMTGILVGFSIGALLFLQRLAQAVRVEHDFAALEEDAPDAPAEMNRDIVTFRISGAFFFGAASRVAATLDRLAARPKAFVIDFSAVPILDSSGAAVIAAFVQRAAKRGVVVVVTGAARPVLRDLLRHGVRRPAAAFRATFEDGMAYAKTAIATPVTRADAAPSHAQPMPR